MTAHVLILVENLSVPFDRRVWQESRALVEAGYRVSVICPMGTKQDSEADVTIDGVRILRYPLEGAKGGPGGYLREYGVALWRTTRRALWLRRTERVDVVHACNPPDLLFLVALVLRVLDGTRFVFDQHDLVPELFESRFAGRGRWYWLTRALERLTFAFADGVISTNGSYRKVAIERGGVAPEHVRVVRSAPDLSKFLPLAKDPALRRGKRYLVAYLGVMGPQDGVDYALRALAYLRELGRDDFHAIFMGAGDAFEEMLALSTELGLEGTVEFTGRVPDEFVQRCLSTADVCLSPDPLNPLNNVSTMNKVVEYMAMGRPLVSFELVEARVSAAEAAVYVPANDESASAVALSDLLDDPERRERMGRFGRARVEAELSWDVSRRNLTEFYHDLFVRLNLSQDIEPHRRERVRDASPRRQNGSLVATGATGPDLTGLSAPQNQDLGFDDLSRRRLLSTVAESGQVEQSDGARSRHEHTAPLGADLKKAIVLMKESSISANLRGNLEIDEPQDQMDQQRLSG